MSEALITLYRINLERIIPFSNEEMIYRITPSSNSAGQSILYDGYEYIALEMESEGWEVSASGNAALPRPRVRIINSPVISEQLSNNNNFVGAEIQRIRINEGQVNNGINHNANYAEMVDYYTIDRLIAANKNFIEFELISPIDQEGLALPRRQLLQDVCTHTYRAWNETKQAFDYRYATCPYVKLASFNEYNQECSRSEDNCAKTLSACKLRFSKNDVLPTRAFPGVNRWR